MGERGGELAREDLYIAANSGEAGLCRGVANHQFPQPTCNTSARRSSDSLVAGSCWLVFSFQESDATFQTCASYDCAGQK